MLGIDNPGGGFILPNCLGQYSPPWAAIEKRRPFGCRFSIGEKTNLNGKEVISFICVFSYLK